MVYRLLAARAQSRPDEPAFIVGADGRSMSWLALAAYAQRIRELAGARRLPPRARVGLVVADPLAFAAAYLGVMAAGLTVVPIDHRLPGSELGGVVARLRVDVLVLDEQQPVPEPGPDVETWLARRAGPVLTGAAPGTVRPSAGARRRPAVLLTSSGTTGEPKGIPLSERQLLHAARRVAGHHRLGPGERGYSPLPLFHVNAQVMGLLAALVSGASLVLDGRFEPDGYWSRVADWSPTWLNTVPAILAGLVAQPAPPEMLLARLRFARSASAPLPAATQRAFTGHTGVGVLDTYGMTEAAGQITANPLDVSARRDGSVGVPVGVGLAVLGPDGRTVPPGSHGMVALRGRQVISRYLELPGHGSETDRPARDAHGWLPTGDLGFRDEDGFVYLVGRADDVINRGGEKVHPQEVENVLLSHAAVGSAAVVAAPHDRLGQVPVAFVTLRPNQTAPDQTAQNQTAPDQTASNHAGPNHAGPNHAGPNHAGPDQSGPDQSGPDQSGPDQTGQDQDHIGSDHIGQDHIGPGLTEELHRLCARRLPRFKQPTVIEIAAALPTGPTGKVLRRTLRDRLLTPGGAR